MADKSNFTPDEWKTVLTSPMFVATAVTLVDESGLWGMFREGMAGARAVLDAKSDPGGNELVKAIAAEFETSEGRGLVRETLKAAMAGGSASEVKVQILEKLADVGRILDTKAPEDAGGVKTWLEGLARQVAEAASEGGFMGFGGVKVSDAEKASLGEISQALRHVAVA